MGEHHAPASLVVRIRAKPGRSGMSCDAGALQTPFHLLGQTTVHRPGNYEEAGYFDHASLFPVPAEAISAQGTEGGQKAKRAEDFRLLETPTLLIEALNAGFDRANTNTLQPTRLTCFGGWISTLDDVVLHTGTGQKDANTLQIQRHIPSKAHAIPRSVPPFSDAMG